MFEISGSGWSAQLITSTKRKFNIMDEVAIASDNLNLGFPVGHKGYIMVVNPVPGTAFDYAVRVPGTRETLGVPARDLMPWEEYLDGQIESALRQHQINEALDTRDEIRFRELTGPRDEM